MFSAYIKSVPTVHTYHLFIYLFNGIQTAFYHRLYVSTVHAVFIPYISRRAGHTVLHVLQENLKSQQQCKNSKNPFYNLF